METQQVQQTDNSNPEHPHHTHTETAAEQPKPKSNKWLWISVSIIIAVVAIILIYLLTTGGLTMAKTQTVAKGDLVSVDYTGTFDNGTVFDSSVGRTPLKFTAGVGQVIPGFDNAVIGMKVGDEKDVHIEPEDAYGTDPAEHPLGGQALNFKIKLVKIEKKK